MAKTYGSHIDGTNPGDRVHEIPDNKTLLAVKCTQTPSKSPKIIPGLHSTAAVFAHYQPEHTVFFETTKGTIQKETFQYRSLNDFSLKTLEKKSSFMQEVQKEKDRYLDIVKKVHTHQKLRAIIDDPEAKNELLQKIKSLKETIRKKL